MKSRPNTWWMLSVGLFASLWTHSAQAEGCTESTTCPKGYTCQEYQAGACAGSAPCAKGADCPPPPPCEIALEHQCVPADCNSDADCADFMVCHTETFSECSGGAAVACAPNTICPSPPPVMMECTQKTLKQCTPRYALPCTTAADCGDGFTCEASEECSCSSSAPRSGPTPLPSEDAGTAASSGTSSGAFAPPQDAGVAADVAVAKDAGTSNCECHPSELKSCRVKEVTCQADSDCPSNFACITYASGSGSASCDVQKGADGGTCTTVETKSVEEKRCEPKYGGGSFGTKDGSAQGPVPAVDLSAPGSVGGSTTTNARETSHASDAGASDEPKSSGSCSVRAPGAAGSGQIGAALFVLLAFALRRRQQR